MELCFRSPSMPSWRSAQLKQRNDSTFSFTIMLPAGHSRYRFTITNSGMREVYMALENKEVTR